MSDRNRVDLAAFQALLANAYAVQESGLDTPSLSALIEIQSVVTSEHCELDPLIRLIPERALEVANASGVAIGLLDRTNHELVYRAGTGTAANDVGRRVPAVLSVSRAQEPRREILRVENAHADSRIEAEICRQFGAMSLLMLPIYQEHALVGILQVLFSDAHSFQEREVRSYRLMIAALEEGMLRSATAQKHAAASVSRPTREDEGTIAAPEPQHSPELAAAVLAVVAQAAPLFSEGTSATSLDSPAHAQSRTTLACETIVARQLRSLWHASVRAATSIAIRVRGATVQRSWAIVTAVILFSVSVWIYHARHRSGTTIGPSSSATQHANSRGAEPTLLPRQEPTVPVGEGSQAATPIPGFRRFRIGPNEVDYVATDVTIRTFIPRPAKPQVRSGVHQVNFGDDVTVRYFAAPAFASQGAITPASLPDTIPDSQSR